MLLSRFSLLRFALAILAFFFIAKELPLLSFFRLPFGNASFYALFLIIGISLFWHIWYSEKKTWPERLHSFLIVFAPTAVLFTLGISISREFHFLVFLSVGLYFITLFAYLAQHAANKYFHDGWPEPVLFFWRDQINVKYLLVVVTLTSIFFFSGVIHLTRFAAVDEPLWMDGRIGKFWKNIAEMKLDKTDVSDKPGITVAILAGPGLFFAEPKEYRDTRAEFSAKYPENAIEDLYLAFRLPLFVAVTLLLPLFFFLLMPIIGRELALYGYAAIALSPITLGMSRIVNPDALLWLFVPLSFLALFAFFEKRRFFFLIVSGLLFGLALLTKYVANFLVVYGFFLVFWHTLSDESIKGKEIFTNSLRKGLLAFALWIGTGLALFYLLLPATWLHPGLLFESTLFSQAFEKISYLFIAIIALVFLDQRVCEGKFSAQIMLFFRQFQTLIVRFITAIFLVLILFTLGNGMLGFPWLDASTIFDSPKTSFLLSGASAILIANFHPLVFGVPPLILIGAIIATFSLMKQKTSSLRTEERLSVAIIFFILLFYLGSAINGVALINRYQIVLYPLFSLLGAFGFVILLRFVSDRLPLRIRDHLSPLKGAALFSLILLPSLVFTPFPTSYTSPLLPERFTIDEKDMGSGSYEAAQYLNSLPQAKDLSVWTDKSGLCKFFIGTCYDGFNFEKIQPSKLDYIVVSSGRESRTERMLQTSYRLDDTGFIRLQDYYEKTDPVFEILVNGRSGQFVKIFPFP